MTQNTRLYMTVENEVMDTIDALIKTINQEKPTWRAKANRQSLMRGLLRFALSLDIDCVSGYQKYVTVRFRKQKELTEEIKKIIEKKK